MTLGEILQEYRTRQGLSIRQFAKNCGVSHAAVAFIEKGVNPRTGEALVPSVPVMKKLASGMNLTLQELLQLCDDMEVALRDTPDYQGSNPRIAKLVESVSDFSRKELDDMLAYAEFIRGRR